MLKHHDLAMTYELENSGDSSFQNLCVLRTHGIRPGTTWDPQNQKDMWLPKIVSSWSTIHPISELLSHHYQHINMYQIITTIYQIISTYINTSIPPCPSISLHSFLSDASLGLEKHEPLQQVDEGLPNPRRRDPWNPPTGNHPSALLKFPD